MSILSSTNNSHVKIFRVIIGIIFSYQLVFTLYTIFYLDKYGRLPLPFYDDASDSFMDFYNVVFYSIHKELLVEWKSIYPSFVFLVTSLIFDNAFSGCFEAKCIRATSFIFIGMLTLFYGAAMVSLCQAYRIKCDIFPLSKYKFASVTILYFFFIFSYPSIFAIDRGNYILIFFIFYTLYFIFINNFKISILCFTFSTLFKPYMIFLLPLVYKNSGLYRALFLVVMIFSALLGTYLIFPYGTPLDLTSNISKFVISDSRSLYEIMLNATSFFAYIKLLHNSNVYNLIEIENLAFLSPVFSGILLVFAFSWAIYCIFFLLKNFHKLSIEELAILMALNLLFFVDGMGLYALLLLIPPFVLWASKIKDTSSTYSNIFIVLLLILFLPISLGIGPERSIQGVSFYGQNFYASGYQLPLISLIRPIIIFLASLFFYKSVKQKII